MALNTAPTLNTLHGSTLRTTRVTRRTRGRRPANCGAAATAVGRVGDVTTGTGSAGCCGRVGAGRKVAPLGSRSPRRAVRASVGAVVAVADGPAATEAPATAAAAAAPATTGAAPGGDGRGSSNGGGPGVNAWGATGPVASSVAGRGIGWVGSPAGRAIGSESSGLLLVRPRHHRRLVGGPV